MKILAIDTTTELASVALTTGNEVISEEQGNLRQHAQLILPMIERLLAKAQLKLADLNGIAFGAGPGSFTGLRIACSIVKGLAYAHDLPVFPVNSLLSIAHEVFRTEHNLPDNAQILALIDARMHQLYWADFSIIEPWQNTTTKLHVSAPQEIALNDTTPCIMAGVGFDSFFSALSDHVKSLIIKKRNVYPHACALLHLVMAGYILPVDAAKALPYYVRNQVTQGGAHG